MLTLHQSYNYKNIILACKKLHNGSTAELFYLYLAFSTNYNWPIYVQEILGIIRGSGFKIKLYSSQISLVQKRHAVASRVADNMSSKKPFNEVHIALLSNTVVLKYSKQIS